MGKFSLLEEKKVERQPTKSKKPRPDRRFDTTSLGSNSYGYRVHRDYAAHFFRWGFVKRYVKDTMAVLDVGCGVDCPLVKSLSGAYPDGVPKTYVGVDLNKLNKPPVRPWATYLEEFEFTSRWDQLGQFDVVTCMEVIEHMGVEDGAALLEGIAGCLLPGGRAFISTPVFNGLAAANHVHEYEIPELAGMIDEAGMKVVRRYGTFANYNDIKKVAKPYELQVLNELNEYYANDVTACFLAPLYPDASRNCMWVCELK